MQAAVDRRGGGEFGGGGLLGGRRSSATEDLQDGVDLEEGDCRAEVRAKERERRCLRQSKAMERLGRRKEAVLGKDGFFVVESRFRSERFRSTLSDRGSPARTSDKN